MKTGSDDLRSLGSNPGRQMSSAGGAWEEVGAVVLEVCVCGGGGGEGAGRELN